MASGKLNSLSVERAHRFGGPVLLLSDGDGLYFRKQTREGAAWMFRYLTEGAIGGTRKKAFNTHCLR